MASYYKFLRKLNLRALINSAFDLSTGHDHDGTNSKAVVLGAASVAPEKLTAAAKTQVLTYRIEDLAAGVDIADRVLRVVPAGQSYTLVKASIIPEGAAAGVDAGNTCVVTLKNGANTIVAKTYNDATPLPNAGVEGDLGALDATHKIMAAGASLKLSVTNGATADPSGLLLQIAYTLATAA
jgi:hypothetical protein